MNIFEIATKNKFRFPYRGMISVEDMWDLSVNDLDSIFKALNSQLKKASEESLLGTKSKKDKDLETAIEIVKHIVNVKLEEENSRLRAKEQKEQKQKIMEILSAKQDESLQNKTIDELTAMLEELDK